jgi:thioredoxin 1
MEKNATVKELSPRDFEEFAKKGLVLVDFFADWCMPCVMMAPVIGDMAKKFKGKIKFGKVDIEKHNELAQRFNISSIPNFILFKDGKKIEQFVGSMPASEFERRLRVFA